MRDVPGLVLLLLVVPLGLARSARAEGGLAIVQGATSASTTQVAVLAPRDQGFRATLQGAGTAAPARPTIERRIAFGASQWEILQVRFDGLRPGVDYRLVVSDPAGTVWDVRTLRALDPNRRRGTFAVASCMDDTYDEVQRKIWPELLAHEPDLVFLIGDNVYADIENGNAVRPVTGDLLWRRYVACRNALVLFTAPRLVPVLATWDDHDFGTNDGDRRFPLKAVSAQIFRAFFPQEPIDGFLETGPGMASTLVAFGQRFVLMDDRTFRSPDREVVADETHWGPAQEAWLYGLVADPRPPVWILNGDQFFGGYQGFESYEGCHPRSFARFTARLREQPATCVFVSGDRHLAELMRIEPEVLGYATFELTTSAIHARTFPGAWDKTPNPRQIAGVSGACNYAIVQSEVTTGLEALVTVYGPGKQVHFKKPLWIPRRKPS